MDIKDLKQAKAELEHNIYREVSILYEQFKATTGVMPDCISVDIMDITYIGNKPTKRIAGVTVGITL